MAHLSLYLIPDERIGSKLITDHAPATKYLRVTSIIGSIKIIQNLSFEYENSSNFIFYSIPYDAQRVWVTIDYITDLFGKKTV